MARNREAAGPRGQQAACVPQARVRAVASVENATQPSGRRRSALLGTVAAGMLLFGYGRSAQAQVVPPDPPCDTVTGGGTIVTCTDTPTDNVSTGVSIEQVVPVPPTNFITLDVTGLRQDITPAADVSGIYFGSYDAVTINANTTDGPGGPFQIITTGTARGVYARSIDATINFTGTINSENVGIFALTLAGGGDAKIVSTGDVTSNNAASVYDTAIVATSLFGNAYVKSTGIIDAGATGIFANAPNGDATIISVGDVTAGFAGLDARGATAMVTSTGDIEAGGAGIVAIVDGGSVAVTSTGNINAVGDGIFAKMGFPSAGAVTVTSHGNVTSTSGYGIYAYSAISAATVNSTGNIDAYKEGIVAHAGSSATVTHTGDVTTHGNLAYGISADANNGTASATQTGTISTRGYRSSGISATGFSGATVRQTGSISTTGDYAHGAIAVSLVGLATARQTGTVTTRGDYADGVAAFSYGSASVTKFGYVTTHGYEAYGLSAVGIHAATVASKGNVTTYGDFAFGIYAYSYDGPITVTHTGNIMTRGVYADGLYAYSETGSKITITQKGDITVTGPHADAIDVDNPDGAGSSLVIIKAGSTITGGTGGGDGIDFQGGTTNRLKNFGTITTRGENAIEGEGSGAEIVDNYGTITGNIHLGPGANRFNNRSGGLFNSGATAFLGAGNLLHDAGRLSPGGAGKIRTTALTGNMVQTGGGTFAVDLDLGAATTDRVNATGTAKLAGTVAVTPKNPALLTQEFVILSADGGVTNNGLALGPVSPALQAELLFPNPNDVVLGIDVDFAPDGLNWNQTAIGNSLNSILGAGGGTLGPVFSRLFNVFTLNAYRDALDQLSPEIYADTEIAALYGTSTSPTIS